MATQATNGTTRSFSSLSPLARNGAAILGFQPISGEKKPSDATVSKVGTQTLKKADTSSPQRLSIPIERQVGVARSPSPKKETPSASPESPQWRGFPHGRPAATVQSMEQRSIIRKDSSSNASSSSSDPSPNVSPVLKPSEESSEPSALANRRKIHRPRGQINATMSEEEISRQNKAEVTIEGLRKSVQWTLRITTDLYSSFGPSQSPSPLSPSRQQGLGLKKIQSSD